MLTSAFVDLEQLERTLRERLDALGPAPRAELLHVLMLPDLPRSIARPFLPGSGGGRTPTYVTRQGA